MTVFNIIITVINICVCIGCFVILSLNMQINKHVHEFVTRINEVIDEVDNHYTLLVKQLNTYSKKLNLDEIREPEVSHCDS